MNVAIIGLLGLVILALLASMIYGLVNLAREGAEARRASNKMMRWRVMLQGVVILILFLITLVLKG